MIARLVVLLLAVTAALPSFADTWRAVKTVPYVLNNKQDAISFADASNGWYGNGTGRVYRTIDGGDHWSLAWRHAGTYVRALAFADAQTGYLGNVGPGYFPDVRDRHVLYATKDGGTTWTPVAYEGPRVTGICAIDVLVADGKTIIHAGGRVGGPAGLIASQDGGATWQSRDLRDVTGMVLDVKFVDAQTGFLAGASEADESRAHARILKTIDGGATWRSVYESDRSSDVNWKLAFPTPRTGYATIISYDAPAREARGYVVKTEDGGEHWTKLSVTRDTEWIPYGIAFLDAQRGFVGGSTGGYETRDGGMTWVNVALGESVNKFSILPQPDGTTRVLAIGQSLRRGTLDAR